MHAYVFACLLLFAVVSATVYRREQVEKVHNKCQSDPTTHIDNETFDKIKRGEKVSDPKLPKYTLCMYQGFGVQNQNGDINQDKLRELLENSPGTNMDRLDEMISKCGTRSSDNAEEAATDLTKCLLQFRPEHHEYDD